MQILGTPKSKRGMADVNVEESQQVAGAVAAKGGEALDVHA